ncbi:MAG: pglI 3, partial [Actinomycetia bacterium]|nr:pglI 3 [Actinomycetes bacterium]
VHAEARLVEGLELAGDAQVVGRAQGLPGLQEGLHGPIGNTSGGLRRTPGEGGGRSVVGYRCLSVRGSPPGRTGPAGGRTTLPQFSIVIPTRNRASLLPHAVESVLAQADADVEVIVSDNHSVDDTAAVIDRYRDRGVRHVRPPASLSMPDHWDFAAEQATGDWLLLLADDDVFCPNLVPTLRQVVDRADDGVVSWLSGRYTYRVTDAEAGAGEKQAFERLYYYAELANELLVPSHTGDVVEMDARQRLRRLFALEHDPTLPRGYTSACRRDVVDDARRRAGRLFIPLAPDYSFPAVLLSSIGSYLFVDAPLQVFGAYPRSGDESWHEVFVKEFGAQAPFDRTPIASPMLTTNLIAETLLRVKEQVTEGLEDIEIDWEAYFLLCWNDLLWTRHHGVPMAEAEADLRAALARQPDAVRTAVEGHFSFRHPWLADRLRDAKRSAAAAKVRRVAYGAMGRVRRGSALADRRDARRWLDTVPGGDHGFDDILGAAAYAARTYAPVASLR